MNGVLHCRVRYSQLLGLHEQVGPAPLEAAFLHLSYTWASVSPFFPSWLPRRLCSFPLITPLGRIWYFVLSIDISGELPKKLTVCGSNCSSLYSHPPFCFPVPSLTSAFACAWKNRPPPSAAKAHFFLSSELQLEILFPSQTNHSPFSGPTYSVILMYL